MTPPRLLRLPVHRLAGGLLMSEARGIRARTLGLALLPELPADRALLIPRCRSVHTWGMRFALDLVFLAGDGTVRRVVRNVPPRRTVGCRRARSVVELPAGGAERFLAARSARAGTLDGDRGADHYPRPGP